MSSSGLIYAVIVGAWAAYLVPMWLRRQDELNEARPTERFSTAIRLLSGKAAMERRYAKDAERREAREARETGAALTTAEPEGDHGDFDDDYADDAYGTEPDDPAAEEAVDVRAFADPKTMVSGHSPEAVTEIQDNRPAPAPAPAPDPVSGAAPGPSSARDSAPARSGDRAGRDAKRAKRAKLLARRRRTTMLLFLGFTLGAVVAAVLGLAFLWVPAVPGALLSAYIVHLRVQERRRFEFTMDRRRAEDAARHLRERRPSRASAAPSGTGTRHRGAPPQGRSQAPADRERQAPAGAAAGEAERGRRAAAPRRDVPEAAADRRALVEQTDHAEWIDQQRAERARDREHPEGEGWEPVPVPLPTYVSAPVAPRTARDVNLEAPDAWSSARSSAAGPSQQDAAPAEPAAPSGPTAATAPTTPSSPEASPRSRRSRDRNRTPLFDQYEDEDRPRAANE